MPRISQLSAGAKRLLVGRPFRSDSEHTTRVRKRVALPVLGADTLSSVAYAPQEIVVVLSLAGVSALTFTPWVGLSVAVVMAVVVACYRQNIRAYPSGRGDYEVATVNLGRDAGLVAGAALLVDYVLTVAVSVSAAVATLGSVLPAVHAYPVLTAAVMVVALTAVNLRGSRETGVLAALAVYAFVASMSAMIVWGLVRVGLLGHDLRARSADIDLVPADGESVAALAVAFIVAKAIASGSTALTGIQAVHGGVPGFHEPRARNAAATLVVLGVVAVGLLVGLLALARRVGVQVAADPSTQLLGAPGGYVQETLVAQVAGTVLAGVPGALTALLVLTTVILLFAANSAFHRFPDLASMLARDRFLPRQLATRGDRLAFSNGIILLAAAAVVLVAVFDARVTVLIELYIVGVFVAFTLSQLGMVRHWGRHLALATDRASRSRIRRARLVSGIGLVLCAGVLLLVVVTRFFDGAYVAVLGMVALFGLMKLINRHYAGVARELDRSSRDVLLPSRTHCVVLVSTLHLPTLRALAYARATRPDTIEAVTVNIDTARTRELIARWQEEGVTVPLKVVESPYREITRPVVDYVTRLRARSPRDVVAVYIPEYVVGRWWEQLLHNQSALRLKSRLLYERGVMVTSVPWQLSSTDVGSERVERENG